MGFWHLIFGIFGGGDGEVSANAIESDSVVVVSFRADAEVVTFSADAEVVDFTR